jgi:hypothetical protein
LAEPCRLGIQSEIEEERWLLRLTSVYDVVNWNDENRMIRMRTKYI